MPHIVLSEEQARILKAASESVEVRDKNGHVLGRLPAPVEAALIAEAKRRLAEASPRYAAAQVEARLRKLEEISRGQPLDKAKVQDLLRRMRAGEEV
jgi:hypothetical protein